MTEKFATLSIEQRIGQLFIIGIAGPELDVATKELLDEISPGGVCLFARNIREASQVRDLTDGLRSAMPIEPIIAIDQEGGLVDRLRRLLPPMPAADRIRTREEAVRLASLVSEALLLLGLNMDFAPVVDVIDNERTGSSNGLTSRTFGSSKEEAAELAGEFLTVIQSKGIVGCLKHFPGLGASRVDSHEELPVVDISEKELITKDIFPYRKLIATGEVHAVMVAHAAFPCSPLQESDQNGRLLPSSLSGNFVNGLLRSELGFDGLVITDDLEMGAITRNYGIGDACVKALLAGTDMLAICADPEAVREGYKAVSNAVRDGQISDSRLDDSLDRIAQLKSHFAEPGPFDLQRLTSLAAETADFASDVSNR